MTKFLFSFVFVATVFISGVCGAKVKYGISEIEYFNRRQYQASTQNWSITQAENGLLYIANNDGILEYDGYVWRLLPTAVNSIPRAVLAHKGRLYVGANGEFGYYKADSLKDLRYNSIDQKFNVENIGDIWNIFSLGERILFQSENAICIYTPDSGVEIVPARSRIPNAWVVNGMLLAHDEMEGLMELRQDRLFRVPGGEKFAGVAIGAILPRGADEVIIGTMNQGLFLWDMNGIQKWEVPVDKLLKSVNVFSGTIADDNIVFGTIQSGVVVTDQQGNIKMIAGKDKGLYNNTVLGLFIDKQKNIWAGLDNGIARIAYNSSVSFIQGYFDLGTGYCMERQNSEIYFGTNQGLYVISHRQFINPEKDRDDFERIDGTNGQVWAIFKDEYSPALLCGHNYGVFSIANRTARLITPPSVNGVWGFRYLPGSVDRIIAGTYNGFILLKRTSDNDWKFDKKVAGFNESARFFEWDQDGRLWLTHGLKGVYRLVFNEDYSEVVSSMSNQDFSGMENYSGISLSAIGNRLIFSSNYGVYTLSNDGNALVRDRLESFFDVGHNRFPSQIIQDRFGNIWFFIEGGLGVLRKQEDGSYLRIDNPFMSFKNKLVNGFESIYVWDEETSFFGVEDGFGQYTIGGDINYLNPFNVHIRGLNSQKRNNESFFTSSYDGEQENSFIPVFRFSENAFDVSFSATWYGRGVLEYSTWLDGFDEGWSAWGTSQNRQFTRVPEGEYEFRVKSRNIYNVETAPATFKFVVMPPWYRTGTAKMLYALVIVCLLVAMFWVIKRIVDKSRHRERLKQQQKFLEREEQLKHEALINEKEMVRLRNEKLQSEMLFKEKELANSTMNIIQKNDFLLKVKDELLKIKRNKDVAAIGVKVNDIVRKIDRDIDNESQWEVFELHLEQVHEDFLNRLKQKFPEMSSKELKLCAYLRMDMASKEISSLMNISVRAVENNRYKLRKKMGLEGKENLIEFIMYI